MDSYTDRVSRCLLEQFQADQKLSVPMNALIVWTELGKALSGTVERKGADAGLIGRLIVDWCRGSGATAVDLERWAYRVAVEDRISANELAEALQLCTRAIEEAVAPVAKAAGEDGGKAAYLAAIKGWFPVGLSLLRMFPSARGASESELHGALWQWTERYFPRNEEGAESLGVRSVRE